MILGILIFKNTIIFNRIDLHLGKVNSRFVHYSGALNHLPYLLSISVSVAVIKDFLANYIKALGLNQAYYVYVVEIV